MSQQPMSRAARPTKVVREVAGHELLTRLGEGGSGTVFKARQPGLERYVALKILSPQLAREQEYLTRFQNEARAAASVNHPHIVQVLASGYDSDVQVPYIVYEFVDGVTLTKMIEERGPLPEKEALAVTKAVGEALGCLAEKGLVHRDVKPDNILITREGVPKLTDLGLAKQEADWNTLTATGIVMGTPDYMAPEQATGRRDLDFATDVYALGIALYVMLTARLPYQGQTLVEILRQHLEKDCPDPRAISQWVSPTTAELVKHMTCRDRRGRYAEPAALVRDITRANAGQPLLGPLVSARASASGAGARKRPSERATPRGTARRPTSRRPRGGSATPRKRQAARTPSRRSSGDLLATSGLAEAVPASSRRRTPAPAGPVDESFALSYVLTFVVASILGLAFFNLLLPMVLGAGAGP